MECSLERHAVPFYVLRQDKAARLLHRSPFSYSLLEAPNPDFILGLVVGLVGPGGARIDGTRGSWPTSRGLTRIQLADVKSNAIKCVCGARCEAIKEDFVVWHGPPHALQWVNLMCLWERRPTNPASSPTGDLSFFILVNLGMANHLTAFTEVLLDHAGWLYKRQEVKTTSSPLSPLHSLSFVLIR